MNDIDNEQFSIYVASKTKHAPIWLSLREQGLPIISTWIDEAGPGESTDLSDLWIRCIREASSATALLIYNEPNDILKGGWVELGCALSNNIPVFAVGIENFTIANHPNISHFNKLEDAITALNSKKELKMNRLDEAIEDRLSAINERTTQGLQCLEDDDEEIIISEIENLQNRVIKLTEVLIDVYKTRGKPMPEEYSTISDYIEARRAYDRCVDLINKGNNNE